MLGIGDGPARQQSVVFAACNFDVSWYGHLKLACGEVGGSIEALGVPVNVRGEALSLEQFAQLSNIIGAAKKE